MTQQVKEKETNSNPLEGEAQTEPTFSAGDKVLFHKWDVEEGDTGTEDLADWKEGEEIEITFVQKDADGDDIYTGVVNRGGKQIESYFYENEVISPTETVESDEATTETDDSTEAVIEPEAIGGETPKTTKKEIKAIKTKSKASEKKVEEEKIKKEEPQEKTQLKQPAKEGELVPEGVADQILTEISHGAIKSAKKLSEAIELNFYVLGGVVDHLYETGEFEKAGYSKEIDSNGERKQFRAFIEGELSISYERCMHYRAIYKHFKQFDDGVIRRAAKVGWSKIAKIVLVAKNNPDDWDENLIDELLSLAEDNNRKDLDTIIKTEYLENGDGTRGEDGSKSKLTTVTLKLFEDDFDVYKTHIDNIKEENSLDRDDQALMFMVQDHALLTESADIEIQLPAVIEVMVNRFGKEAVGDAIKALDKQSK